MAGAVVRPDQWRDLIGAFREAFGDRWEYAWEVARCESDDFAPDVIYGPRLGAGGEKGIFQLHPRGVLPVFLAAGFTNPFDPYEQITFVAAYTLENGWGAWTCATLNY